MWLFSKIFSELISNVFSKKILVIMGNICTYVFFLLSLQQNSNYSHYENSQNYFVSKGFHVMPAVGAKWTF